MAGTTICDKWLDRFRKLAFDVAEWSEDNSTQVGAVTFSDDKDILTTGWNGLPRGVEPEDHMFERPEKYWYFEHAERNALYNATRLGVSLKGASIMVTHFPCPDCARGIIQAGIKKVYFCQYIDKNIYAETKQASEILFSKAGIEVIMYENVSSEQLSKICALPDLIPHNLSEQCKTDNPLAT